MTKREAKRYACREASAILQGFLECGSEFSMPDPDTRDAERVRDAMREIVEELGNRGDVRLPGGRIINGEAKNAE